MEDVIDTVQTFVRHLYRPSGYVATLFHPINDIPQDWFFTFVARIHLHADRNLMGIQKKTQSYDRFLFVFLGWSLSAEVIFTVNLEIEVRSIEVGMGSIHLIFLLDLMIVDLYDLFILGADIFQAGIELVQREIVCSIQLGDHFFKSSGF